MSTKKCMIDGSPVTPDHKEINEKTGLQKGYVVLCKEERDKGFVRPYRDTYVHVGRKLPANLRELTEEEHERYDKYGYVKYEEYDESKSPVCGRFWKQSELEAKGCGGETTMHRALAETYSADNLFYSHTFCSYCSKHFLVEEFIWKGTNERVGD